MVIAKKSLGQHWLTNTESLNKICDLAELNSKETVLEIGPGTGNLSELLIKKAGRVVAVEKDDDLADELRKKYSFDQLWVISRDILKFNLKKLDKDFVVVANIPYYLTSNLIRVFSESENQPIRMVLLVQKEVAERIAAKPGQTSLLSITSQYYWDIEIKDVIPASYFDPKPKVDSQIVVFKRKERLLFNEDDTAVFFRLVRISFSSRRKTITNTLGAGLRVEKAKIRTYLENLNINPNARAQELTMNDWSNLFQKLLDKKLI